MKAKNPTTLRARPPSLLDVAKHAGVSRQAAGAILTGKHHLFRPETVAKVCAAAEALAYRPSAAGQSLRLGSSRTIGLVQDRFLSRTAIQPLLLAGIEKSLSESSMQLVYCGLEADVDPPDVLRRIVAEGFLINYHAEAPQSLERALMRNIPAIYLNVIRSTSSIHHDEWQGAHDLTVRCLALYGSVGWIDRQGATQADIEAPPHHSIADRLRGYLEACAAHGVAAEVRKTFWGAEQPPLINQLTTLFSGSLPRCLIISEGIEACMLAHLAAARRGLRVPDDLALACVGTHRPFDLGWDMPMAIQDWNGMAKASVEMIRELLAGRKGMPSRKVAMQVID